MVLFCKFSHIHSTGRQRRQFRIFNELLQLVPGLRDRILDSMPDETAEIADLVSFNTLDILFCNWLILHRSRKVPLVPGQMIRKA